MTDRQTGKGGHGLLLNNLLDRPQHSICIMWVRLYTSDLLGKAILRVQDSHLGMEWRLRMDPEDWAHTPVRDYGPDFPGRFIWQKTRAVVPT
jgi:hypothetical protein